MPVHNKWIDSLYDIVVINHVHLPVLFYVSVGEGIHNITTEFPFVGKITPLGISVDHQVFVKALLSKNLRH